jgi:hypothetical protein|tara:strand:+ start:469 stop:1203 length:735 start_codon:yes stop_codon:yes gene_type:complete
MPYLPEDAAKKSNLYNNLINGDRLEYEREIEDLIKKQQISGSTDSNMPLRDDNGILVSFESEEAGVALEESFQDVRLENSQFFFEGTLDQEFKYYFQPEDVEDDEEEEDTGGATDEEVEFQMTKRDNLIQVINEYFNEEYTPDISTDLLHNKLYEFFKIEGPKGGSNAEGWKEFRQANINVKKFRKKGKKKYPGSGGKPYANYRDLRRDIEGFHYDDVIRFQLYYTNEGQRIWLKLGFPYQPNE